MAQTTESPGAPPPPTAVLPRGARAAAARARPGPDLGQIRKIDRVAAAPAAAGAAAGAARGRGRRGGGGRGAESRAR